MADWLKTLLSGFNLAAQSAGANQRSEEMQALGAMRGGESMAGIAGIAAALGNVAANASSTSTEQLHWAPEPWVKKVQGGADVSIGREKGQPKTLRVRSTIYVYSDVVTGAELTRKCAKIQNEINNYWNNQIPRSRELRLTSVAGGALAFSYGGLPALSIAATGNIVNDAASLAALWTNNAEYDDIGTVIAEPDGTISVTFLDMGQRGFTNSSTGGSRVTDVPKSVDRTLRITAVPGERIQINYNSLASLSVLLTGDAVTDAQAILAAWNATPGYNALGSATDATAQQNCAINVVFNDGIQTPTFTNTSTGLSVAYEERAPVAGTRFKASYTRSTPGDYFATKYGPSRTYELEVIFDVKVKEYVFTEPTAQERTDRMNQLRAEMLEDNVNLIWFHLNDNTDENHMTSWASGGLGTVRASSWPGEYAHEFGHCLGHWMKPTGGVYLEDGEHSTESTLMGRSNKSLRRVAQDEIDQLNFSVGLCGFPDFPGSIIAQAFDESETKTIGHTICAKVGGTGGQPVTYLRDQVIYLDMPTDSYAQAKPEFTVND